MSLQDTLDRLDDLVGGVPSLVEQMALLQQFYPRCLDPEPPAWATPEREQRVDFFADTSAVFERGGRKTSTYSDIADVVRHGTRHRCSCGLPMPQVEPGVWLCRTCGNGVTIGR